MSLINDALKRASQSDKSRPAQARLPRPMQPVATPPRGGDSSPWLVAAMAVAGTGLAVALVFFLTQRNAVRSIAAPVPIQPVKQTVAQAPPPAPTPAPIVQKPLPPPEATTPPPAVSAVPVIIPPVAALEVFPTNLTVKAIFYSKINPRALVNGRTVETGDKIGDVLVTGIMSDRVFVDWKGQSKVLMMGGQ
jgi:hypothetical protein